MGELLKRSDQIKDGDLYKLVADEKKAAIGRRKPHSQIALEDGVGTPTRDYYQPVTVRYGGEIERKDGKLILGANDTASCKVEGNRNTNQEEAKNLISQLLGEQVY